MSRRLALQWPLRPERRREAQLAFDSRLELNPTEIEELRRSIRAIRRVIEQRDTALQSSDVAKDEGRQASLLDDLVQHHSFGDTIIKVDRPRQPLFVAWLSLCNESAAEALGERAGAGLGSNDDRPIDWQALSDLLDEVEERLDRLEQRDQS
jgi:hypothetical protein